MLTQDLHDAAIRGNVLIIGHDLRREAAVTHLEHRIPTIGGRFVRADNTEIRRIGLEHIAHELPLDARGFGLDAARPGDGDGVSAEVGQTQVP